MSGRAKQLQQAAELGHLAVVQDLLVAGVNVRSAAAGTALLLAATSGHLGIVECLLAAGVDVHSGEGRGLRLAAGAYANTAFALSYAITGKHTAVVRLLREWGARLSDDIRASLGLSQPDLQLALLSVGDIDGLSAADLAREGVCPEAICVLLSRQEHAEVAAMLKATQMLERMAPEARHAILVDMLADHTQPEIPTNGRH